MRYILNSFMSFGGRQLYYYQLFGFNLAELWDRCGSRILIRDRQLCPTFFYPSNSKQKIKENFGKQVVTPVLSIPKCKKSNIQIFMQVSPGNYKKIKIMFMSQGSAREGQLHPLLPLPASMPALRAQCPISFTCKSSVAHGPSCSSSAILVASAQVSVLRGCTPISDYNTYSCWSFGIR